MRGGGGSETAVGEGSTLVHDNSRARFGAGDEPPDSSLGRFLLRRRPIRCRRATPRWRATSAGGGGGEHTAIIRRRGTRNDKFMHPDNSEDL